MIRVYLTFFLFSLFVACDTKEVGEEIAKRQYAELEERYLTLKNEYALKVSENRELSDENRALKEKIEAYKNGFKSMYQ